MAIICLLLENLTKHGGKYAKITAVMRLWTGSYYRIKYEQISKRRGKKRAIIAIARMILTATFHMLSTGEVWNPCDLQQIDMPPEMREKELQKSLRKAAKLLVAHGVVDLIDYHIPETAPA